VNEVSRVATEEEMAEMKRIGEALADTINRLRVTEPHYALNATIDLALSIVEDMGACQRLTLASFLVDTCNGDYRLATDTIKQVRQRAMAVKSGRGRPS
jgi:hypothetical protein